MFGLLAAQLVIYGLGLGGEMLFARRDQGLAAVTAMSCSSGMAAFVGLPIVMNLFPGNHEAIVIAGILAVLPTITLALGQMQLEFRRQKTHHQQHGNTWKILLRAIFFNPLVLGMIVGGILCATGIGLWKPLENAVGLIGMTSAPCGLLALGLDIQAKLGIGLTNAHKKSIFLRQSGISICKLILPPPF